MNKAEGEHAVLDGHDRRDARWTAGPTRAKILVECVRGRAARLDETPRHVRPSRVEARHELLASEATLGERDGRVQYATAEGVRTQVSRELPHPGPPIPNALAFGTVLAASVIVAAHLTARAQAKSAQSGGCDLGELAGNNELERIAVRRDEARGHDRAVGFEQERAHRSRLEVAQVLGQLRLEKRASLGANDVDRRPRHDRGRLSRALGHDHYSRREPIPADRNDLMTLQSELNTITSTLSELGARLTALVERDGNELDNELYGELVAAERAIGTLLRRLNRATRSMS